jgi:peptidoglycan/LPS O-acetylase OafA/YrhL
VQVIPRENNLDLLRLFFAFQVVLWHVQSHFKVDIPSVLQHFPGVPAFFFVSGFLIYASYLNAPGRKYLVNRLLRLFPALAFVTLGGVVVVVMAKGLDFVLDEPFLVLTWFFSQITLGQAWNPTAFKDIGIGVINGSLWTITVEILFYISVPMIVFLERRLKHAVVYVSALSFFIYQFGPDLFSASIYRDKTFFDVLSLTPFVWGWMFGLGILAAKNFGVIQLYLKYFYLFGFFMLLFALLDANGQFNTSGNRLGFAYFLCFAALILWAAFHLPALPLRVDLSYGVYIWHAPLINLFLVIGIEDISVYLFSVVCFALVSWFAIERPALRLKPASIRFAKD